MGERSQDEVRRSVREAYADIATGQKGGCAVGCCGTADGGSALLGYSAEELAAVPEGSDLGLGCGNPQAIARLAAGDVVLDLGSGPGFDCLLAARAVGPRGRVVGVDMTPEMITRARDNARRVGAENVDFRLGEIERLPVADATIDVILSNCVINLSPDKASVLREAFRVLKPGGRLAISDVIATHPLPPELADKVEVLTGCVAGAATVESIEGLLRGAGFEQIRIDVRPDSTAIIERCMPGTGSYVASATIEARRPSGESCCAPSCCEGKASA